MNDRTEAELFERVVSGDEEAFERVYDRYHQRVRLVAWRISHRPDWVDDLLNEAWCRAFGQRMSYDPARPFVVWMAGILRNVYREECRKSPSTLDSQLGHARPADSQIDDVSPERIAAEAELLGGLNECVDRLGEEDARVIRLRFFEGKTLRQTGQEVRIPESTLRDVRIPAIFKTLRLCLESKGIRFSGIFPAQAGGDEK
jgi:RNA polymerase sigma-70 factor (ECF subfamily)